MTLEDNKALVRRWIDVWMKKDLALLDELFTQDYTVNGALIGLAGVKQAVEVLHISLSNISAELHKIIAEDDKVVIRWTVRGRHEGHLLGIPPTGKEVELKGINIYQVINQKLGVNHEQTNVAEVIQRLKADSETDVS